MDTSYLTLLTVICIGFVFPAYAILTGKSTREMLIKNPEKKVSVYQSTLISQFVLIFLVLFSMILNDQSLIELGLVFILKPQWFFLLYFIAFFVLWLLNKMNLTSDKAEKFKSDSEDVLYILPATLREYKWAITLSLFVGLFEEIIFRGFLYWQLLTIMPLVPALILTNIIFGLSHYGTKLKNAFSAFSLGIIWSISYVLTDSLWLAILLHICIDIYSTTMAFKSYSIINSELKNSQS